MLDGLIHSYLETAGRAWEPLDAFVRPRWDSLLPQSALSSRQMRTGEADAVSYTHLTLPTIYSV